MQHLKHFWLVLAATFIVGFVAGMYVYFIAAHTPPESTDPVGVGQREGFEVIADAYGGCQMLGQCPSYRIDETGNYDYLYTKADGETERESDMLSQNRRTQLQTQIENADLAALETTEFVGTCPAAYDGAAYTFEIIRDKERYAFDTCEEDLASSELFALLIDYFEIFAITHAR